MDFGVYIKKCNSYDSGARNVTEINVPGRNGTIIIDNGNYENSKLTYECRLLPVESKYSGFDEQTVAIKAWLYADVGNYHSLTDTYGASKMAAFTSSLKFVEVIKGALDVSITFSCKPKEGAE
ncbi:MAG: hypothetical protein K2J73_08615 [Oscillospiraceae bacterium]|nr:hypothetical protein [Oscillospiraceae bacterium]